MIIIKKCIIVGAGDFNFNSIDISPQDLVIAADGGYNYLKKINITPDIIVGDFDSITTIPTHKNIIKLPQEKDDTDMLYAIKTGLKNSCSIFDIYGATGGRFDHTMANIQCLLFLLKNNASGYLYGNNTVMTCIQNRSLSFSSGLFGTISIFSISEKSYGVTLEGLKYPLDNVTLENSYPLGVSNEFIDQASTVTVKNGTLLIIYEQHIKD